MLEELQASSEKIQSAANTANTANTVAADI